MRRGHKKCPRVREKFLCIHRGGETGRREGEMET